MTDINAKITFTSHDEYKAWRADWKAQYKALSEEIRVAKKARGVELRRDPNSLDSMRAIHRALELKAKARGYMEKLEEAKLKMAGITKIKKDLAEQHSQFPLEIEADKVDFHFNKKHLELDFIPMWVLKTKGRTFYVNHVDSLVPWTTKETPDHPSTKGALRVRKCKLSIDALGNATLS